MKRRCLISFLFLWLAHGGNAEPVSAASGTASKTRPFSINLDVNVDGVKREGLLHPPQAASPKLVPLVFIFHGHGGTAAHASRTFRIHELWPESVCIYLQGLPTPGHLNDKEGKQSGWQLHLGDQSDRDLAFFDATLAQVKSQYRIDPNRIYSTGHSNGGAFTYLLWETRRSVFAAFAPSGCAAGQSLKKLTPAPVLHIAGADDPLVRIAWQRRTLDAVKTLNACAPVGVQWADQAVAYPSTAGTPLVEAVHPGGHEFPKFAPALIVKFFQEHARRLFPAL